MKNYAKIFGGAVLVVSSAPVWLISIPVAFINNKAGVKVFETGTKLIKTGFTMCEEECGTVYESAEAWRSLSILEQETEDLKKSMDYFD